MRGLQGTRRDQVNERPAVPRERVTAYDRLTYRHSRGEERPTDLFIPDGAGTCTRTEYYAALGMEVPS